MFAGIFLSSLKNLESFKQEETLKISMVYGWTWLSASQIPHTLQFPPGKENTILSKVQDKFSHKAGYPDSKTKTEIQVPWSAIFQDNKILVIRP